MFSERFAIGVDVGGTNMRAASISPTGDILRKKVVAGSREPDQALDLIKALIRDMGGENAAAIGIGIPGRVDGWTGEVISGGFLDLSGKDLKGEIAQTFGLPVMVANDCGMALIGEARRGAASGLRNVVMLTIGTGIGGATMDGGKVVHGKRCAGQFGHLIVNVNGQPCPCGQRGCVETESSGTSLRRHLNEAGYSQETRFEHVLPLAISGDPNALAVMRAWAGPLRAAVNTLSAAVDPDVVILGGGMGHAALQALSFLPAAKNWYEIEIRGALLGDDAGVIGAGLAAFDLTGETGRPAAHAGKGLVMVNGVPGSGKSSLSHRLSSRTGWPVLALDTIKNPFLELIEDVDRPFNRVLGRASYKSIFSIVAEAPEGSTFIVDAWFGFQPRETLLEHVAMAGITGIVELWCHAPPETVGERYSSRASQRLPGHPGQSYVPELIELAKRAEPYHLGPVLDIDTTKPQDVESITTWVKNALFAT
ncbi:ROK family protein [Methylovirgula sp. 4M-Z18]|uniref:ROK family protein n=1 Tax=Methylovirgula sp. 4M-Z18 TaxID=2293567 RepID=UPI000E2F7AD7|nr:ROK family protein [Methylovirgula sp. 4M-Z18]RFB76539.1 ROK family protein [Methylovirgula sp. 4M-Z18]